MLSYGQLSFTVVFIERGFHLVIFLVHTDGNASKLKMFFKRLVYDVW